MMNRRVNNVPIPREKFNVRPVLAVTPSSGPNIKICLWNLHIIYPTSHYDELPLYQRKENNFL